MKLTARSHSRATAGHWKSWSFAILTQCLLLAAASGTGRAADDRVTPTASVQDLLLLGPLEPFRLRLTIEFDGVPFRTAWREAFNRLFKQYDSDRDGRLTPEQSAQVTALLGGNMPAAGTVVKPNPAEMLAGAGLSQDDLRENVEQSVPQVRLVQQQSSRGAGPALVPLLDADGDGRLSREELRQAAQSLHCRDFNDDQLITEQELLAGPAPADVSPLTEAGVSDGSVILLTSAMDATSVAEMLLARYDRNRDGALALSKPAELQSDTGLWMRLDTDGDGLLTRTELRGYVDCPPDAELPFAFGGAGATRKTPEAASHFRLRRKQADGGYRLHVGSSTIDFGRNNRDPAQDTTLPRLPDYDADASGSLNADEFMNVPDRPDFAVIDTDRDQKITASEFDNFFQLRAKASAAQIVLEVSDQGSDLFTTLDRNFDRVLTPRELLLAPDLLSIADRDGDGYLGGTEMSYNLVLKLSRGAPRAAQNLQATARGPVQAKVKAERTGPVWFQKMDRNRDGDVGQLEFLGNAKIFSELDTDHDGLLSSDEATAWQSRVK